MLKLCNPEWNEDISEDEGFMNALQVADEFWKIYIKHAVAEVEAIEIILYKVKNSKENYLIFDCDMPYRKAVRLIKNNKVKYFIFKSRRQGYDIRAIYDDYKFDDSIVKNDDVNKIKKLIDVNESIYIY